MLGAGGARALPSAPTPTDRIDRLRLPLPYVVNICFRCFSYFKGMLQLFLMDVAKVDRGCCKCFKDMLQEFIQNVSSVLNVCCKRFDLDVAYVASVSKTCCKSLVKMFYLF